MDQVISIEDIWGMLKKHWKFIVTLTLIGLVLAGLVTKLLMTPKYEASVDILVNRKTDNQMTNQLSDQQADVNMINTYKDIITRSVTLVPVQKEIKRELGYKPTLTKLKSSISVSNNQNSQVFSVSVKDSDPARAATIANTVAKVFKEKVKDILEVNNVTIIAKATKPKAPVSPRLKINLAIGMLLGLFLAVGIVFIRELTDHNVKDMEFLTDELGLTKLGIIGHNDGKSRNSRPRSTVVRETVREEVIPAPTRDAETELYGTSERNDNHGGNDDDKPRRSRRVQ